jgi:hypothetical protein
LVHLLAILGSEWCCSKTQSHDDGLRWPIRDIGDLPGDLQGAAGPWNQGCDGLHRDIQTVVRQCMTGRCEGYQICACYQESNQAGAKNTPEPTTMHMWTWAKGAHKRFARRRCHVSRIGQRDVSAG